MAVFLEAVHQDGQYAILDQFINGWTLQGKQSVKFPDGGQLELWISSIGS